MPLAWMNEPSHPGEIGQEPIGIRVHQALVETGQLDLVHVQVDEIRVKGCKIISWMG